MTRQLEPPTTTHRRMASQRHSQPVPQDAPSTLESPQSPEAEDNEQSAAGNKRQQWTPGAVRALGVHTDLVTAGALLGIGRTKAHELARRNEFPVPVLRHGRRYIVPVAPIARLLQLTEPSHSGDHTDTA
jgi:hypothetical protein